MSAPAPQSSLVLVSALCVGALGGSLATLLAQAPDETAQPTAVVSDAQVYTPEELEIRCLPYMRETATSLEQAQTKVSALEVQIRDKEDEIKLLEAQIGDRRLQGQDLDVRLEEARVQLLSLQTEREAALREKQALIAALQQAREQLASSRMQLAQSQAQVVEAREATLESRWDSFQRDAKLDLCKTGSSDRVTRCRELVETSLERHKKRFKDCLRTDQAVPEIRTARPEEELPVGAMWLARDEVELKDWYVLFCDQDLPEAPGNGRRPPPFPMIGGGR